MANDYISEEEATKAQLDAEEQARLDEEERQRLEAERKAQEDRTNQTLKLVGASTMLQDQLPSRLPTQAPITPPGGLPEGVTRLSNPNGRMYMGPNIPDESVQSLVPPGLAYSPMTPDSGAGAAGRVASATAPVVAPPVPVERLAQAQALDQPGSRTISIRNEPPYSDASLASQKNRMAFEAMQRFNAGDRSPEVLAAAIGSTAGYRQPRPVNQVAQPQWIPANPQTGAPGYFATGTGTVHVPTTPKPPGVNQAVINRHKALIADEMQAVQANDPARIRESRAAREAFEQEQPSLGLARRATTTTGTNPSTSAPSIAPPPIPSGSPSKVTSKAQFDALTSGTIYIGSDGKKYKKP